MGSSQSQLQPHELVQFKKLPTDLPLGDIDIPEREENRRPTNVKWLVILGVFLFILLPFLIYTLYYSDFMRFIFGYDKCGNVCGRTNYHWDGIACSGKDMTEYPYLQYENSFTGPDLNQELKFEFKERRCVRACRDGYDPFFGRCIKNHDEFHSFDAQEIDVGVYFASVKWQLIVACLLSVVVSMLMVFLFRYAIALVVWSIIIGGFLALVVLLVALWVIYIGGMNYQKPTDDQNGVLIFMIAFTIFVVAFGLILIWSRKKIRLVILLYKETAKAIFDMPGLIAIPVIFAVCLLIGTVIFTIITGMIYSSGILRLARTGFYVYELNGVMIYTLAYNVAAYIWFSNFLTGIQYMIVAGAVSKWYFTREKTLLRSPIFWSTAITFKYHLGTVALGSLLLTLMQVIKSIILGLCKNHRIRVFVQCCLDSIENFFKFLSKNAYIVTAIHGQGLIKSGKRAAKLIIQNVDDIIAVNFIGDFVLAMAKLIIVIISVLLAMLIFSIAPNNIPQYNNTPAYIAVAIVSLSVACVSFGVFETTVDTLFICYCEDNLLNDGTVRPYYMSTNLKEFVEESKKVYKKTS